MIRTESEILEMLMKIKDMNYKHCGYDPYYPCCIVTAIIKALKWVLGDEVDLLSYIDSQC